MFFQELTVVLMWQRRKVTLSPYFLKIPALKFKQQGTERVNDHACSYNDLAFKFQKDLHVHWKLYTEISFVHH